VTCPADAALAAALFAIDPAALGGVALRALHGPVRTAWIEQARSCIPTGTPWRRVPVHATDGALLGGLDLAATLHAGRPQAQHGLLAQAHGGIVQLLMAERISALAAARVTAALDLGMLSLERDGLQRHFAARFGVIAMDESSEADASLAPALRERLALHLDLGSLALRELAPHWIDPARVVAARARVGSVLAQPRLIEALAATTQALGIDSLRPVQFALRVARHHAALNGRDQVDDEDAAAAARLVLAARAVSVPAEVPDAPPQPQPSSGDSHASSSELDAGTLDDLVLAAALAALPPGLLERLKLAPAQRARSHSENGSGVHRSQAGRGRPAGVRPGNPVPGERLSVVDTLRAAAPWQVLRGGRTARGGQRLAVRREDFRIARHKRRTGTTAIFVVDASGSSALHRMAEAKGAVELLLADCYVRRDRVALIAFRAKTAELLLPPTRSLTRARRNLAELPGGGTTPLAAGIDSALMLAQSVARRGDTPVVVLMTDGRANVGRDGTAEPARAEQDAIASAQAFRHAAAAALFVDTSPRPRPQARAIADAMGAHYLPLPYADAAGISTVVRDRLAAHRRT